MRSFTFELSFFIYRAKKWNREKRECNSCYNYENFIYI